MSSVPAQLNKNRSRFGFRPIFGQTNFKSSIDNVANASDAQSENFLSNKTAREGNGLAYSLSPSLQPQKASQEAQSSGNKIFNGRTKFGRYASKNEAVKAGFKAKEGPGFFARLFGWGDNDSRSQAGERASRSSHLGADDYKPGLAKTAEDAKAKEFTDQADEKYVPNPNGIALTNEEFKMVYEVNKFREEHGKDALAVSGKLMKTANDSSDIMDANSNMKHGYTSGWSGENIAMGQKDADQAMDSWVNSAGHRRNMLRDDIKTIGVGDTRGEGGQAYWTQQFGRGEATA